MHVSNTSACTERNSGPLTSRLLHETSTHSNMTYSCIGGPMLKHTHLQYSALLVSENSLAPVISPMKCTSAQPGLER